MSPEVAAVLIGALAFATLMVAGFALAGRRFDLQKRLGISERAGISAVRWQPAVRGRETVASSALGQTDRQQPRDLSRLHQKLGQAGIRRKDAPALFISAQATLTVTLFVVFAAQGYFGFNPLSCAIAAAFFGIFAPYQWLSRAVFQRKERIRIGLADALDLTVVCVEAGLGLDQSIMRIGQEMRPFYPDLSYELLLVGLDVNAGRSRTEALRNLARRTDIDDVKALASILIQTDRYGTSVGQALRDFVGTMRTKRRQAAEERGAKLGAKMIVPMVLFIFPAMFVVTAGPAVINMMKTFSFLAKR